MKTISSDHVVEINYTLTDDSGTVLDSSNDRNPLTFIQGKNNIIPGLEMKLQGKRVGDIFTAVIPAEQAYGIYDESLVQAIPTETFGSNACKIQVGNTLEIQAPNGQALPVKVIKASDQEITLDANHQLAGKNLTFDVEIISVRKATVEELFEGRVVKKSACCSSSKCGNNN